MVFYEYDSDSGDISLSTSTSSPQLSSFLRDTSLDAGPSRPRPSPRNDPLTSPTPQRLYGKTLWRPQGHGDGIPELSLNNGDEDPVTPTPGSSFWGTTADTTMQDRPLSANDRDRTPTRPTQNTRRTSSNTTLTRSRSLNIRLSPIDTFSNHTSDAQASPSKVRTPSMRLGWSRRPGEPRPPPLVGEGVSRGVGRWIKEIVVCNFDLERGPVVERRVLGRRWGRGEKENVAFSSFPDTSLFTEGSIQFSFKIRHIPPDPSSLSFPEPPSPMPDRIPSTEEALLNGSSAGSGSSADVGNDGLLGVDTKPSQGERDEEYRKWDERGREWLYGFVWFEQRVDKGIARGYMQKSLVILTHLPFPSLFAPVLDRIAPNFFEHGYSVLEAACHSVASWPDPVSDRVLELPLMSDVLNVKLPDSTETPQIGKAFGRLDPEYPILASLPTSTPLRAFANCLTSLWSIWECLVLAEPILIIAPDPRTCSEIVWWLRDLMRPIPPAGDLRPYLHIHDHDFALLVNSNKPQAGVVVGVTNPFFRNAASHWPNIISIPSSRPRRINADGSVPSTPATSRSDAPEGFLSRRHRSVQKDRAMLKRLEGLVAEGKLDDPSGNEALRVHFQQLTEKMLVPLNRYFQTLLPTLSPNPTSSTPSTQPKLTSHNPTPYPSIKPFSLPAFLSHQRTHGPNPLTFRTKGLSTKARVESDFYTSFAMGGCFAGWLAGRIDVLGRAVRAQGGTINGVEGNLDVPGPRARMPGGVGLGISGGGNTGGRSGGEISGNRPDSMDGSISVGSIERDRMSSEDESSLSGSASVWRGSEESMRARFGSIGIAGGGGVGEGYFGRRGSEGSALTGLKRVG